MAKSAFEKLSHKLEDNAEGDVNITIVVDADAAAVEEALDQEELDTEISEGEQTADLDEAMQEEAAEMRATAVVLREHGLNEGMRALLIASGRCAMYGISLPGKEALDASGRNMAEAEAVARGLEAKEATFMEKTANFFKEMWDRIIRAYTWISTKLGSIRGKCERARDSLKGKIIDSEKIKDNKTEDINDVKEKSTNLAIIKTSLTKVINSFNNADQLRPNSEKIDEAAMKKAIGYSYEGDEKDKLGEQEKDFMKPTEKAITADSVKEYYDTRWTDINGILMVMEKTKGLISDAESAKKSADKRKNSQAVHDQSNGGKEDPNAKSAEAKVRSQMSLLVKVSGKFVATMSGICSLYVRNCAKVRACCKVGD